MVRIFLIVRRITDSNLIEIITVMIKDVNGMYIFLLFKGSLKVIQSHFSDIQKNWMSNTNTLS